MFIYVSVYICTWEMIVNLKQKLTASPERRPLALRCGRMAPSMCSCGITRLLQLTYAVIIYHLIHVF